MNLAEIIEGHDAQRVALISRRQPTTYGELRDQVASLRGGLLALGIEAGDRVALLCGNARWFVDAYLATVGIGAVAVPLNPSSPAPELEGEIAVVGAVAVVVEPSAQAAWDDVDRARVPTVRFVIAADSSQSMSADTSLDVLAGHKPMPLVDVDPDHLGVLIFTSGTAGSPRAAMLSHGNLRSNIDQSLSSPGRLNADDIVYGLLPVYHIMGLNVVLNATLAAGGTVVLVQRFDPSTMVESIRERGITVVPGAPPMWTALAQLEGVGRDDLASVRLALTGAARMPEDTMRDLRDRLGVTLREGYGLTEASPVVTSSVGVSHRFGSVGRVLHGIELRLVDESGADALEGDAGEVWVRGPNVFLGYWNDPEATAKVLTPDGWLRTGDVAVTDSDGYVYLVDRIKDLIIVSGFNVFPAEVEHVLRSHPAVAEAAVVGVAHPHTGEAVKAYVVARPGTEVDEDTLVDYCHEHLARYKCPSKVLPVDVLPRSVAGKLLRRELV